MKQFNLEKYAGEWEATYGEYGHGCLTMWGTAVQVGDAWVATGCIYEWDAEGIPVRIAEIDYSGRYSSPYCALRAAWYTLAHNTRDAYDNELNALAREGVHHLPKGQW